MQGADLRAGFLGAGCAGLGWRIDFGGIGAKVRAPVLSRRWISFLFASWLPHAKYASWGCLGLTLGDRHRRSQNWWRIPRTGTDALAAASDALLLLQGRSPWRCDVSDGPDESDEFASDGCDHDRSLLSTGEHSAVSSAEPDLRLPGNVADLHREGLLSLVHGLANLGGHSVGPRRLHDQPSRDDTARFGDAGESARFATLECSAGTRPT